jgi:hypothetical protein
MPPLDLPYTLPIPPDVAQDPRHVQMLSAWLANGQLVCGLNIGFWQAQGMDEAACFGVLLADTIRHIADALAQEEGGAPAAIRARVLAAVQDELARPTSDASGGFAGG